jgi:hypothetical protein
MAKIPDKFEESPKQGFKYVKKDLNDSLEEEEIKEEIQYEKQDEPNLMESLKKDDWLQESIRESIADWKSKVGV